MAIINLNTANTISCLNDLVSSVRSFIFAGSANNPSMEIVQGADSLLSISLKDFFITLTDYSTHDFRLKANSYLLLNENNIVSALGEVQFIAIIVTYPKVNDGNVTIDTEEKYIQYEYPEGATPYPIGKMMILSGSTKEGFGWDLTSSPGGIKLHNPHEDFDVTVKVLAFN